MDPQTEYMDCTQEVRVQFLALLGVTPEQYWVWTKSPRAPLKKKKKKDRFESPQRFNNKKLVFFSNLFAGISKGLNNRKLLSKVTSKTVKLEGGKKGKHNFWLKSAKSEIYIPLHKELRYGMSEQETN